MAKTGPAIMIFIGLILIFLAIFGISGIPLGALSGTLVKEDWNSLTAWSAGSFPGLRVIENGELHMMPLQGLQGRSWNERFDKSLPAQFTLEAKIKVDSWEGTAYLLIQFYTGTNFVGIELYRSNALCEVSAGNKISRAFTSTDLQYHVWTMVVDQTGNNIKLYRDTDLVAEWQQLYSVATNAQICYGMVSQVTIASSYTDYFYVDSGLHPPGEDGYGEDGYITLYTKYSTDGGATWRNAPNVQVVVQKGSVYYATWQTDSNGRYGPAVVEVGTYTFSAAYSTQSDTETITVGAGESKSVTLGFGGEPEPEPEPEPDWWQAIKDFLEDPMAKSVMLLGGVGLVGIGAIMLFSSPKERHYIVPPQYSLRLS